MEFLTEKKLRNLTTERLNALRKTVLKSRAAAQYHADNQDCSDADMERAHNLAEYYDLIKSIMDEREHIEKPVKDKSRPRRDGRNVKRSWDSE
ncbi:hypothetical protein AsFcp4_302 [Aeromonas phage AsFcp_4]|nr:hypothetical protein ASfcp2_65 [Aeromonas phage AsFcp_2]QAX99752.1 hypothetical protein AsFcp4_302 [Aeromonas phage AsFcp_4]